jgi:hypothetical protein
MKQFEQISEKNTKTRDLVLSLLLDAVGMMSFSIPFIGEFADVVWAPISGFIMVWMYKGSIGKVAGVVSFLEEILPATDIIPSFTIMWFYTYVFKKN